MMQRTCGFTIFKAILFTTVVGLSVTFVPHNVSAQVHEPDFKKPEWKKPYKPFRIAGNLYYVGTYDLGCYLITTPQGHILVNTGLESSSEVIKKNMASLGFKIEDIKILLLNQAHFDHMGGIAGVKKMSGAQLMADEGDVATIEDGGKSDYIYGSYGSFFQPVKVDRVLHDGDKIALGGTELTMLHHPGHTRGSCSYLLTVKDEKRSYKVLIANMPKMLPEVEPAGMHNYPDVGKDFEYTYATMPKLKFDLWVAAHASQFNLQTKHKEGAPYNPSAFMDRKGYDETIERLHKEYLAQKAKK